MTKRNDSLAKLLRETAAEVEEAEQDQLLIVLNIGERDLLDARPVMVTTCVDDDVAALFLAYSAGRTAARAGENACLGLIKQALCDGHKAASVKGTQEKVE